MGALGVVYGDIGTSPLYALRECFHGEHGIEPTPENVLGVLSLIFWSLVIVIAVKYAALVLRADNHGEGGILALMALVPRAGVTMRIVVSALGLFGAALLYGDGVITPAISVLSAVEGLNVATTALEHLVVPITIGILVGLFAFQKRGTAGVAAVFGPLMLVWFGLLAALGVVHVARAPAVLASISPSHAGRFFAQNGLVGFFVLGSVFLVVTGGEALYADMGHFGRRPIRVAWFAAVLPALLLNYWGQGALLLADPAAAENPFYRLVSGPWLYPMVVLATAATVIASQAVISGAFSLTRQAIQLGFCPRMRMDHTSEREIGQIYIPAVNWALMVACIGLVVGFGSSTNLAAAYGVAVTTTMVITTVLLYLVATRVWRWSRLVAIPILAAFLVVDSAFFLANIVKVGHGGWFPLAVALAVFTLMSTWKRGRGILAARHADESLSVNMFFDSIAKRPPARVPGTAVFLDRNPIGTPLALLHNLKHNKVLHQRVVFLAVLTEERPRMPTGERSYVESLGNGFYRIIARYGFMEDPNIPALLEGLELDGEPFKVMDTTFFLSREALIASKRPGMAIWREQLFAWMTRSAARPLVYFRIPPNRVVELGMQVEI
jgi:KUP system potassium uptake protein